MYVKHKRMGLRVPVRKVGIDEPIAGYTVQQLATLLHCSEYAIRNIIKTAGWELLIAPDMKAPVLPLQEARELFSIYIPPEYFYGDQPSRYIVKYFKAKREKEVANMEVKRTKNSVIFKGENWEVEARKEHLKKGYWAVIVNGKFVDRKKTNTGEAAILRSWEVPAYIRNLIKKKIAKKGGSK